MFEPEITNEAPHELHDLTRKGRLRAVLRQVVAWTVAIGLLVYLAMTTDLGAVWRSLISVNLALLIPVAVVFIGGVFLYDAKTLAVLFTRLNRPVSYRDILPVKGASYFLNVVNYNAAAAAMALFLRKRAKIPFLEGASSLILLNVVDVAALNLLITGGLLLAPGVVGGATRDALLIVNVSIYGLLAGSFVYWNAGFDFFVLGRVRTWTLFSAFHRATLRDWGVLLLWRLGLVLLYTLYALVVMHLFHIPVPFDVLLVFNPIITLIGTLPISVSGIGTTQVAMRELYGAFGTTAQIDAFSTTSIFIYQVVRLLIASRYVGQVKRDLDADRTVQAG